MTTKTCNANTKAKPGRLTDNKWWFCEIGQHGKCATEIELSLLFEGCPCECHRKVDMQPAPDTGEWSLSAAMVNEIIYRDHFASSGMKPVCIDIPEPGGKRVHYAAVIVCVGKETAARILTDHNAVAKLVDALVQARNNAQAYTGARYLDTAKDGLRDIVRQIDAVLAAVVDEREGE